MVEWSSLVVGLLSFVIELLSIVIGWPLLVVSWRSVVIVYTSVVVAWPSLLIAQASIVLKRRSLVIECSAPIHLQWFLCFLLYFLVGFTPCGDSFGSCVYLTYDYTLIM